MTNVKVATIVANKESIKVLRDSNIVLFKEVFNEVLAEAKNVKSMNMFSSSPKNVISQIIKANLKLDKDLAITSLALNYYESGLSLDINESSISFIRNVIKYVKNGKMTKSQVNKGTIEEIKAMIKALETK